MRLTRRFILVLSLLITSIVIPIHADSSTVSTCDFASLSASVTLANSGGGTITFDCSGTIIFANQLVITADVIMNADGNTVIFDGNNATRFFTVNAGASLELNGFTLQNANGDFGGAIYNDGSVTISDSTFTGNSATDVGGVIYNSPSGTLTISNSTFTNNTSDFGGAFWNDGTLTISTSTFTDNSATTMGGAILFANNGILNISDSNFTNNSSLDFAGAIGSNSSSTTLTVNNTSFTGNSANVGGAISAGGTMTINTSTFTNNSATNLGGAIRNTLGTATINDSTFTSNSANQGGAIYNDDTLIVSTSTFANNSATSGGGAIYNDPLDPASSEDSHYENNTCEGFTITNNGGNTVINAAGCPGNAPVALDVSALSCNGDNAEFTINAGDGDFTVDGASGNFPLVPVPAGLVTLTGPNTWTDVTITERGVNAEFINIGGISCAGSVIIPPVITPEPAPTVTVTVLGCALDSTDGVDIANAPDNTYCRVLMKNGGVVSYSGAIPADLIGLGVILAVDVYRLEGGQTINTFPDYARVCLAGQGRLFYMDGRNAPRYSVELASESVDGLTCGWIPAPGTLILTN